MKPINILTKTTSKFTYNYNFLPIVWVRINVDRNIRGSWPVRQEVIPPLERGIRVVDISYLGDDIIDAFRGHAR